MWAKLDDRFPDHPKVLRAGGDAAWLHVCALCYSAGQLTNGQIPTAVVPRLSDRKNPMRLAEKLVEVGLWEPIEGGYQIHDYLEWNPPAEKVRAERARKAKNVADYRARRSGERADDVTDAVTGNVTASETGGVTGNVTDKHHGPRNRPVTTARPDPVPSRSRPSKNTPLLQLVPDEPSTESDHTKLIASYVAAYEKAKGVKPIIDARIGKAAKELLKRVSLAEAQEMIRRAFEDKWFRQNQGELWQIANAPNKWRGSAAPSSSSGNPRQPGMWNGETPEHTE